MKKTLFISLFIICLSGITWLAFSPNAAIGSISNPSLSPSIELPDSIRTFVEITCMSCHSDTGSAFARGKVNFSKWMEYDAEKQSKEASDICEEVKTNSMPPKKWRANNPEKAPTQAQADMICRWAESLRK